MKISIRKVLFLTAALAALSCSVNAQLLTYQTVQPEVGPPAVSGFSGSVSTFNGTTRASQGEIFTNVLAIDRMTYNLFTTGSPIATNLTAKFGQWDINTNAFTGATLSLIATGPTGNSVPGLGGWSSIVVDGSPPIATFELAFDITAANGNALYTTNPALNYALMLTQVEGFGVPGSRGFGIGKTDLESDFVYGTGAYSSNAGVYSAAGSDFTFSQIIVIPNLPVVPEASTVASIFASLLVAGLVIVRIRQRNQMVSAPISV
jgi:hypothetical protein